MFGKKAPSDDAAAAADEVSVNSKPAATTGDEIDSQAEDPTKGDEEAPEEKEEKPAKVSWWRSALGGVDIGSLLSTAQGAMDDPNIKDALAKAQAGGKDSPDAEQLMKALAAQQNATGLLQKAQNYKDKAMKCLDPEERQKMMQEAYDKEVEANGQSKFARRMQSGTWQGGAGGAGAGVAVGTGLGTVVGALVGGVVSLPTTALGGLVGMGVGGIHGPFVKLNQKKAKEVEAREKAKGKSEKEIKEAVEAEAVEEASPEEVEAAKAAAEGAELSEDAEVAGESEALTQTSGAAISQPESGSAKRNLQRQQSGVTSRVEPAGPGIARDPNKPRKKPRKLEVRSAKKTSSATSTVAGKENQPSQNG